MCGSGGAPKLDRNVIKENFPLTASPCGPVNNSLLSKIDQSQITPIIETMPPIAHPISSKEKIFVATEIQST